MVSHQQSRWEQIEKLGEGVGKDLKNKRTNKPKLEGVKGLPRQRGSAESGSRRWRKPRDLRRAFGNTFTTRVIANYKRESSSWEAEELSIPEHKGAKLEFRLPRKGGPGKYLNCQDHKGLHCRRKDELEIKQRWKGLKHGFKSFRFLTGKRWSSLNLVT